jgi:FdhD protein
MDLPITTSYPVTHIRDDSPVADYMEDVATEYPLTIYINNEEFSTVVCSPTNMEELVIGFLASEGLIRFYAEDVQSLSIDPHRGFAYVDLTNKPIINQQYYSKRFIGSCCGKSRTSFYFHNDVRTAKTSASKVQIRSDQCFMLMESMQNESKIFKQTGGVHNAALCSPTEIIVSRCDIGRHNALDKIYGYVLMNRVPVRDRILVFSGRISSEVLLKASKIGVGVILSKSAPTDLALDLANDLNLTTIGFIRDGKMNIYTHPERIFMAEKRPTLIE